MLKCIITLIALIGGMKCACLLNLRTEVSEYVPVFVRKNELVLPNAYGFINFEENATVTLLCPGYLNGIVTGVRCWELKDRRACQDGSKVAKMTCRRRRLRFSDVPVENFIHVSCVRSSFAEVLKTIRPCADGLGQLIWIGYYAKTRFIKLYEVCYNEVLSRTLYAKHVLYGQSIGNVQSTNSYCASFKTNGYAQDIPIDAVYSKENQEVQLKKTLNVTKLDDSQVSYTRLIRSRLVPRLDFVFVSWQESTLFLVNTMPQWKSLSRSRWEDIEYKVRLLSIRTLANLTIHTGTHEVMTVKGRDGVMREMYLAIGERVPVPKYFWKIVQNGNQGILFAVLNDPFSTEYTEFCESKCEEYCWHFPNYAIPEARPMWCCNVTREKLEELHLPDLEITDILKNDDCNDKH